VISTPKTGGARLLMNRRGLFLAEILVVNREPQRKSEIANAASLKHFGFSGIDHAGNLN